MWDDQFAVLAQLYHMNRYDVRCFGRSDVPTHKPYSHHHDVKALLDYLGIAQAYSLGHSMGSGIAMDFVLAYPEMADSLISLRLKIALISRSGRYAIHHVFNSHPCRTFSIGHLQYMSLFA